MNCERVRPYLTAYAAGETEAATTAWVRSHVQSCAACRAETAQHQSLSAAMKARNEVEPPEWLAGAVMASVRERATHERRRLVPIPPIPPAELVRVIQDNRDVIVGVAGTAAVAAGAAWLAWRVLKSRKPSPSTA